MNFQEQDTSMLSVEMNSRKKKDRRPAPSKAPDKQCLRETAGANATGVIIK